MGLLSNRGPFDWHPASEEAKEKGRLAAEYCHSQGVELGKLAIWYSSQLEGPSTFLIGMATQEIVDINLDSFWNGLSSKEAEVLDYCLKKCVHIECVFFFSFTFRHNFINFQYKWFTFSFCSQKYNWDGIEIKRLQQNKKNQT